MLPLSKAAMDVLNNMERMRINQLFTNNSANNGSTGTGSPTISESSEDNEFRHELLNKNPRMDVKMKEEITSKETRHTTGVQMSFLLAYSL